MKISSNQRILVYSAHRQMSGRNNNNNNNNNSNNNQENQGKKKNKKKNWRKKKLTYAQFRRLQRSRQWGQRRFRNTPAGYSFTMSNYASLSNRNGYAILTAREIFEVKTSTQDTFDWMLPFTPTKWLGSRTATLCSTYTDFRPLFTRISYIPNVSTNTNGLVSFGTVFSGASLRDLSSQQMLTMLPSTNGGFNTTIWQRAFRNIALGTSLRANTFPLYNIDDDDIPFWMVMKVFSSFNSGTTVGNIVVTTRIALHNPIFRSIPPLSANNIKASVIEDSGNKYLSIVKSSIAQALTEGREYLFAFGRPLLNGSNETLLSPLQFLSAPLQTIGDSNYLFTLENVYSTVDNVLCSLIGTSSDTF